MRLEKYILHAVLVLLIPFLCPLTAAAIETELLTLRHRAAADVLPEVQAMLSPAGSAVASGPGNAIIVSDSFEVLARVKTLLPLLDAPAAQVVVRVRMLEVAHGKRRSAEILSGSRLQLERTAGKRKSRSEFRLRVQSGSRAAIGVGKDIPVRERWLVLARRFAVLHETVSFVRVDSGMVVRPLVIGGSAHIELVPRIAYVDGTGTAAEIVFTEAAASVTVPLGQWVDIGGSVASDNEVMRELFETATVSNNTELAISFLVEAADAGAER